MRRRALRRVPTRSGRAPGACPPRRVHGGVDPHPVRRRARLPARSRFCNASQSTAGPRLMFFAAFMMAALLQPRGNPSCVSRTHAAARTKSQNSDHFRSRPGARPVRMTAWIARSRCAVRPVIGSAAERSPLGCCQAAGIAKGRSFENRVTPGIFVWLGRGRQMLVRRNRIRGGFAPKK